jgi:isopentenyl-diphosphate delta-isomerase
MGFSVPLESLFSFIYKAPFDNGLTEHELDHVLLGYYDQEPSINREEVASWKWMDLDTLDLDIKESPERYTVWFKIIFKRFYQYIKTAHESNRK